MDPTVRTVILNRPAAPHDGISYSALTGVAYAKVPGGALTKGGLTTVFTFTGDNKSYYMGQAGLLVPSVTNTPRIEYDASGNLLGFLMEAAATNQLLRSRDQTNAAWVKTTMTAAQDQVGPDGVTNSACSLLATGASSLSLQTIVQAAVNSTFSFWIKRLVGTGTVGICQDGVTFTTTVLTPAWQRFTLTASQLNPVLGFKITTSGDQIAVDFGQFEAGAFATSAVPTVAATATRAAETCTRVLGAEFSQTAGTFFLQARSSGGQNASLGQTYIEVDDGTGNERFTFTHAAASDDIRYNVFDGGVLQSTMVNAVANLTAFKLATAYALNDIAASFNGAAVTTDASATLPTVTTLSLGSPGANGNLASNGHIKAFDYYPERKSNAFLQQVSTP